LLIAAEEDMEDMSLRDTRPTLLPDEDIEDCKLFDKYLTKLDVEVIAPDISLLMYLPTSPEELMLPARVRTNNLDELNVALEEMLAFIGLDIYLLTTALDVIYAKNVLLIDCLLPLEPLDDKDPDKDSERTPTGGFLFNLKIVAVALRDLATTSWPIY